MTGNAMFEGVFCPSITITNDDGTIDYPNWGRHLDHLAEEGIDGVLLFGSIGEFYSIDVKTKAEVVRFAVSKVAGRMKVLVGVGDTNLDNVRLLAAESEKAGADALVAISPYYWTVSRYNEALLLCSGQGGRPAGRTLQFPCQDRPRPHSGTRD